MRRPRYLSPSSLRAWIENRDNFYLRYCSDTPPPREPQNHHMAIGNSFDAFVKHYLHQHVVGDGNPAMEFDAIFESQVEKHNRTKALVEAGRYLFDWYKRLGALDSLMLILGKSTRTTFEMDVRGEVEGGREGEVGGVPFRVKPDLYFVNEHGAHVLFDWKVTGFYSRHPKSPTPGYSCLRSDGKRPTGHADTRVEMRHGLPMDVSKGLEARDESWARQLSIGAWLCGMPVGGQFVGIVHQLVCSPPRPKVRVAEFAAFVSEKFQQDTHRLATEVWTAINSDHVFRDLTIEESKSKCELLDGRRDNGAAPTKSHDPLSGQEDFQWQR